MVMMNRAMMMVMVMVMVMVMMMIVVLCLVGGTERGKVRRGIYSAGATLQSFTKFWPCHTIVNCGARCFFYSDSENVFAVQLYFYGGTNVFIFRVHVYLYLQCSSRAELGGCA